MVKPSSVTKWLGLFVMAVASLSVAAQSPPAADPKPATAAQTPAAPAKPDYQSLVAKLKGGDLNVDFGALRQAYTETEDFSGYGDSGKYPMFAALDKKKYEEALKLAEKRLAEVYVDLNGHYVAMVANHNLKKDDRAQFHQQVFLGLVRSITTGKDGLTPETAFSVISIDEEKVVIGYLGFEFAGGQALSQKDGHSFDIMSIKDPKTKKDSKMYFNIDRFFGKF